MHGVDPDVPADVHGGQVEVAAAADGGFLVVDMTQPLPYVQRKVLLPLLTNPTATSSFHHP